MITAAPYETPVTVAWKRSIIAERHRRRREELWEFNRIVAAHRRRVEAEERAHRDRLYARSTEAETAARLAHDDEPYRQRAEAEERRQRAAAERTVATLWAVVIRRAGRHPLVTADLALQAVAS